MAPVPLLIMSDAVTSSTGLGRITRDLASRIHEHMSETFDVAVFGYGGTNSYRLPFKQYPIRRLENWIAPELPTNWYDHAGDEKGILLAIWNPGWLSWLADPSILPPSGLRTFLEEKHFEKWTYSPIDAEGCGGRLQESIQDILNGFDRVLHYSEWAAGLDRVKRPWLPHGIDDTVFYPRDAQAARRNFIESVSGRQAKPISPDVKIVAIVATNSARKDWGLGFETCAELLRRGVNIGIWSHVDSYQKHWDLVSMANEFGLANRVIFTSGNLNDDTMAMAYSGCDVCLAIGSSEGYGYTAMESLACGTPVVHGTYGGGAEHLPTEFKVKPAAFKWSGGPFSGRYPVFNASDWADRVEAVLGTKAVLPDYLRWKNLWPRFSDWLIEGVNG